MAFDSATTGCSVAVWRGGQVLAHDAREVGRGQAEVLLPMAADALRTAGLAPQDLDGVAVTRGPGGFTGMRIGLAAARGFALALGVPCIGVTTLEAVARGTRMDEREGHTILAAIESKREDVYVQLFDQDLKALSAPLAAAGPALAELVRAHPTPSVVGDAALRARDMLNQEGLDSAISTAPAMPDTRLVADIAAARFHPVPTAPPEPLYLRPPDAKRPKNQGRARP